MSMLARLATTGGAPTYVDDVFSTYLYTGDGSTQTITNGIDLAGKGGLVWLKKRAPTASGHYLHDTERGAGTTKALRTDNTNAQGASSVPFTSFNNNGFTIGVDSEINQNTSTFASWTFRKAPKFFDVVTYTGTGVARTVAHNLGSVPGMIIVKRTDTTGNWQVYHRSLTSFDYLVLNDTAVSASSITRWNNTTPTATEFTVGTDATVNANGGTYVAYLFAHDTAADGLIQCGSFTTDAGGNATVNLGWEPQFFITKRSAGGAGNWQMFDSLRGITVNNQNDAFLLSNLTNAESTTSLYELTASGFNANIEIASTTFVYIAIRRPNKPPTSGTQVFQPTVYTGTNVDNRLVNTTIAPDMVWVRQRNDTTLGGMVVGDRLRGQPYLLTGSTAAEVNDADSFDAQLVSAVEYGTAFSAMNGFWCGNDVTAKLNANTTSNNHIAEAFKRAPGFFDVVCYTGTGSATTVSHNLGVVPELMLIKKRNGINDWSVYNASIGNTKYLNLNLSDLANTGAGVWNNTSPTNNSFTVGTANVVNTNGDTYVAYLFASLPGISKVGSYTGNGGTAGTNGTSQTINCGFSAGARFVLIKRTDVGGVTYDWYVFDSARGIVTAGDPYSLLNATQQEQTADDTIDPDNSGFIVNQITATNLNVTGGTYIYLAIA